MIERVREPTRIHNILDSRLSPNDDLVLNVEENLNFFHQRSAVYYLRKKLFLTVKLKIRYNRNFNDVDYKLLHANLAVID